eukprot:g6263.t1
MEHSTLTNPVLGIDIGSSSSKVAFISERGTTVEIVQNEVNLRQTPTVVGFTHKQRLEGDAAQSLIKSNLKNSVRYFKHLLGKDVPSEVFEQEHFWSLCPLTKATSSRNPAGDSGSSIGFEVSYLGDKKEYSVMQIVAMLLVKIRKIAIKWCNFFEEADNAGGGEPPAMSNGLTDNKRLNVVLSCPSYYGDWERKALLDAANLAGMDVLRIMTDGAAAVVSYGPYRVDELARDPMHVAFCGCGHSTSFVAVARFTKEGLQLVSETCDTFGARDMDLVLMQYFAEEFRAKYKSADDPLQNKKASLKLEEAIQKTKKVLSSNDEAPMNVECLIEDYDLSGKISRDKFEELCAPLRKRLAKLIETCVQRACLDVSQIDSVEIIGGTSRVQWVQRTCEECFQTKTLSRTLNADEAVVRGCALQAAIFSPIYRVRDYNVWLYSQRGVSICWEGDGGKRRTQEVFPAQSSLHLTKVLSLYRPSTFSLTAFCSDNPNATLGTYTVEVKNPEKAKIQIKAKLDLHGIFSIESATLIPNNSSALPQVLPLTFSNTPGCDPTQLAALQSEELAFQAQGATMKRLEDLRNDVEAEVYRQRSLLSSGGGLVEFTNEKERSAHLNELQTTEDWIYDNQDDLTAAVLHEKLNALRPKFAKLEERKTKQK